MKSTSLDVVTFLRKKYALKNQTAKEFLAEFLGTFMLIIFGNGAVAQKVLAGATNDYYSVVWGYSLGVMMGILVSGNVSGGHINPAVTLTMALWGKLAWSKVPVYMVAQYMGAFAASAAIFGVYQNALNNYESIPSLATASIWATYPGQMVASNGTVLDNYLTSANGFGDQVIGTMLLMICVCAITDQRNMKVPQWIAPLFVGFVVMNIGLSYGFNCGFAINPARDLAPRFFTLIAGWGNLPFTATTVDGIAWWWIPVLAPHIGAIIGMLFYTVCVEMHHSQPEDVLSSPKLQINTNNHNTSQISSGIKDSCQ